MAIAVLTKMHSLYLLQDKARILGRVSDQSGDEQVLDTDQHHQQQQGQPEGASLQQSRPGLSNRYKRIDEGSEQSKEKTRNKEWQKSKITLTKW